MQSPYVPSQTVLWSHINIPEIEEHLLPEKCSGLHPEVCPTLGFTLALQIEQWAVEVRTIQVV